MTATAARSPRVQAVSLLRRWADDGSFPDRLLDVAGQAPPVLTELVYGVVRWRRFLDWVIARAANQAPPPPLLSFLWVGLYQLLKMDSVPEFAAVHETVSAVKSACGERSARFANAVLRRTLRERASLEADLARQPLGIRQSHTDQLVNRWISNYGAGPAETLCDWNNQRAATRLFVNPLVCDDACLARELAGRGTNLPGGWQLAVGQRVTDLPGYDQGHFWVMDSAAQHAVDLLAPQPGEHILDACAAPGGKTALIATRMRRRGRLLAMDRSSARLPRLRANLQRLHITPFAEIVAADLLRIDRQKLGLFDGLLLDAPCSNTGVIRRKPDVRWRFSTSVLKRCVAGQEHLLTGAARLVKPGGRLVYSTCSLETEENEGLVSTWLSANNDWRLEKEIRLFPPTARSDGAYAACLGRLSS